jgi:DNA-binding LytR/AlgR family response regulator
VKGIELGVVKYIVKPLYKEKIFEAIEMYLKKSKAETLELKIPFGIRRVKIAHILAIETMERGKVKVYTVTEIIPCVSGTLNQLYLILPPNFQYIRRDCIINCNAVTGTNPKTNEVTMSCKEEEVRFKVSRGRMRGVEFRY